MYIKSCSINGSMEWIYGHNSLNKKAVQCVCICDSATCSIFSDFSYISFSLKGKAPTTMLYYDVYPVW